MLTPRSASSALLCSSRSCARRRSRPAIACRCAIGRMRQRRHVAVELELLEDRARSARSPPARRRAERHRATRSSSARPPRPYSSPPATPSGRRRGSSPPRRRRCGPRASGRARARATAEPRPTLVARDRERCARARRSPRRAHRPRRPSRPGRARRTAPSGRGRLASASPRSAARRRGLVEHAVGLRQPPELDEGHPEVGRRPRAVGVVGREQGRRALQQADPGRQVAAVERRAARRAEAARGRRRERPAPLARRRVELGVDAVRLLEVVADELVPGLVAALVEPRGVALVEVGARRLRDERVGDVADQDVGEAVGLLAGHLALRRADELPPGERGQPLLEAVGGVGRQEPRDRARVEGPALDRRAVEDRALGAREGVDAGGEQRLDRRREARRQPRRARRASRPSARGRTGSPRPSRAGAGRRPRRPGCRRRAPRAASAAAVSSSGSSVTTELRPDPAHPVRTALEQLRPGEADDQQRDPAAWAATCSRASSSVGSAQWMSSTTDDERTVARRDLEQAPDGPVRLLDRDRAGRGADEPCDARRDAAALVVVARQPRDRLLVDALGQRADDLGQRPVCDALAVGRAAADRDRRARRDRAASARARAATCRCRRRRST